MCIISLFLDLLAAPVIWLGYSKGISVTAPGVPNSSTAPNIHSTTPEELYKNATDLSSEVLQNILINRPRTFTDLSLNSALQDINSDPSKYVYLSLNYIMDALWNYTTGDDMQAFISNGMFFMSSAVPVSDLLDIYQTKEDVVLSSHVPQLLNTFFGLNATEQNALLSITQEEANLLYQNTLQKAVDVGAVLNTSALHPLAMFQLGQGK